jgi:hypothetical protein
LKVLVIRNATMFVCLVSLTLFFVVASPNVAAATHHAAQSTHVSAIEQSQRPAINPTNCTGDSFQVFSSTSGDWCFTGKGYAPITIPGVTEVCSGNHTGTVYFENNIHFWWSYPGQCQGVDSLTTVGINLD